MIRKIAFFVLALSPLTFVGCGGDDDDGGGPGPTAAPRVVAHAAASAPSGTNPDDPIWSNAASTLIKITSGTITGSSEFRPDATTATAVASQITVQAIVFGDTLYVKSAWSDATHDIWRDSYELQPNSLWSHNQLVDIEDQLLLRFKDPAGSAESMIDAWNWRALTTGQIKLSGNRITGFAEGAVFTSSLLDIDSGTGMAVLENPAESGFAQPMFMHKDSANFSDYFFYQPDQVDFASNIAWTIGDRIPGWRIDSTLQLPSKAGIRASRWDIWAVSDWDDATDRYTVVLRCPLNTGYADDLDMAVLDSLKTTATVTDNSEFFFSSGNTDQGISDVFYLILP